MSSSMQVDEYMASLGHTVKRMSLDPSQQQQGGQPGTAQQLTAEDLAGYSRVSLDGMGKVRAGVESGKWKVRRAC
jgi:hypothetical protein